MMRQETNPNLRDRETLGWRAREKDRGDLERRRFSAVCFLSLCTKVMKEGALPMMLENVAVGQVSPNSSRTGYLDSGAGKIGRFHS